MYFVPVEVYLMEPVCMYVFLLITLFLPMQGSGQCSAIRNDKTVFKKQLVKLLLIIPNMTSA